MFTGLIETVGTILQRQSQSTMPGKLFILPKTPISNPEMGESIAINGACLTLEKVNEKGVLQFHVLHETFTRTNLGILPVGAFVNIERALLPTTRLGGHFVSGHIDAMTSLLDLKKTADDLVLKIQMLDSIYPYMVEKGSIAIDGISLTLVEVNTQFFTAHIIPTTFQHTALAFKKRGELVNLEADVLGKYIAHQLRLFGGKSTENMNLETLLKAGF